MIFVIRSRSSGKVCGRAGGEGLYGWRPSHVLGLEPLAFQREREL